MSTVEVTVTARELFDRGIWTRACDLIGFNSWAINEERMGYDERLAFTLEQARKLGLLETIGEREGAARHAACTGHGWDEPEGAAR